MTISKRDLIYLAQLLNKGYSISQSLVILGGYDTILEELEKGKTLYQYIDFHTKDGFYKVLAFFLQISPFDHAILSAYDYHQITQNAKLKWLKEITYPLLVLFFALIVFIFFELLIYPQLQLLIDQQKGFHLHQLLYMLIGLLLIFVIGIIFLLIMLLIMKKQKKGNDSALNDFIGQRKLMKKYLSYDYALYSLMLMRRGYSTKQAFESLLSLKNGTFLQLVLQQMNEQLKQGEDMIDMVEGHPYLDQTFKHFFKIGCYTQSLEYALQDYCHFQEEEFKRYLNHSSKIISISAYIFIAILVISIYQLLLLPLDMMNQL